MPEVVELGKKFEEFVWSFTDRFKSREELDLVRAQEELENARLERNS